MTRLTKVLHTLTFMSVITAGAWWIVSSNDSFLFPESQLSYFMLWGIVSNGLVILVFLAWMFILFANFVQSSSDIDELS